MPESCLRLPFPVPANLRSDRSVWSRSVPLLLCFLLQLGLAACGPEEPAEAPSGYSVVMVMDMAGLGDKGFNDAGWAVVQRAVEQLGVKAQYLQSHEQADYVPNLGLAAERADAVVAMGYLMVDAVRQVAPLHPGTDFIFVDGRVDADNVASFDFKAQEGAYLAGLVAAMTTRSGTVGTVLGMDIPPVRAYESGYRAGIATVNGLTDRDVTYLSATVGDFSNPSRAKALAQGLYARGADILLQLAGNSGLGVIEAARESEQKVWAIGADIDQEDLAPGRVLVSVLKRIDVAVYQAIRDAQSDSLRAGHRWIGIAEGASGLTDMRHTRQDVPGRALEMVERAKALIESGSLVVPWRVEDLETFRVPGI